MNSPKIDEHFYETCQPVGESPNWKTLRSALATHPDTPEGRRLGLMYARALVWKQTLLIDGVKRIRKSHARLMLGEERFTAMMKVLDPKVRAILGVEPALVARYLLNPHNFLGEDCSRLKAGDGGETIFRALKEYFDIPDMVTLLEEFHAQA